MKRIRYTIVLLIALLAISCNKSLNLNPTDFSSPENYYNTETELNYALTGVYSVLKGGALYGNNLTSTLSYPSDEGLWRYNTASSSGFEFLTYNASAPVINSFWSSLYSGINSANMLLENMDGAAVAQDKKNVIRGEALFLRAYYYFLLADHFGGVPLKLKASRKPDAPEDVSLIRSPLKDVYAQILKDMTEAETLVKPITAYNHSGRISQTVVQGILARVCLTMAGEPLKDNTKYADAKFWAAKVINSGIHSLNPNYKQLFVNMHRDLYDIKESMWEVEFFGNTNTTALDIGGRIGIVTGIFSTVEAYPGFCVDNYHTTAKLYNIYMQNPDDLRRDVSIASYRYGTGNVPILHLADQIYDRATAKFRREYETLLPRSRANTPINYPLLRYSDVLLMYAEAENELNGPTADAIDKINEVRRRALGTGNKIGSITVTNQGANYTVNHSIAITGGGGDCAYADAIVVGGRITSIRLVNGGAFYTSAPTISIATVGGTGAGATATANMVPINPQTANLSAAATASKGALFAAIKDERARELAFETIRFHDLKRWGIYVESLREISDQINNSAPATWKFLAQSGNNATSRNVLFPIPLTEITSNPSITQNPGY
ncbi:MAG: RagB/SusD family nutrient uptake outer membrane protein [Acinetobacter sp.]|nr:MAG: RagB/SusD family nutrient uptake outer membrane protein [Acinetobacter sp.]